LLQHVLGFRPRSTGADHHRVDAPSYGALVHRVAERFSRAHGPDFGARQWDLDHWRRIACELADTEFDELLTRYPLVGSGVTAAERRRLLRDVQTLIEHDWDDGRPRAFVDVERCFGLEDAPLALPTARGPVFVTGRIDRIDVERGMTLIRDFKTGRAHPRDRDERDPDLALDLQLAVYAVVTEHLAAAWTLPAEVAAAYIYVDRLATDRERSFRSDRAVLRSWGRRWLELAMGLVRVGGYAQTPELADCRRCSFAGVCGDAVHGRRERLRDATGPLGTYRELKT
jgi:ATP-dependent helicase/DNAse subunit B